MPRKRESNDIYDFKILWQAHRKILGYAGFVAQFRYKIEAAILEPKLGPKKARSNPAGQDPICHARTIEGSANIYPRDNIGKGRPGTHQTKCGD